MIESTVPKVERIRKARALALKEAIDRFNHESMDADERLELRDRIARLRKKAEKAGRAR